MAEISEERRNGKIKKKKYNAQNYLLRIAKLKENGMCRGCTQRKVESGKTYCSICLQKKREQWKNDRVKKNEMNFIERHERPNYGLCYFCGSTLDRDGRSCKKCAERNTNNLPLDRGGRNEYWRQQNKLIGMKG